MPVSGPMGPFGPISVTTTLPAQPSIGKPLNTGRVSALAHANASVALARTISLPVVPHVTGPLLVTANNLGNMHHVSSPNSNVHITTDVAAPGNILRVYNNTTTAITLTQNTGVTLSLPNTANPFGLPTVGNMYVPPGGYVTMTAVGGNTFVVSGTVIPH